MAAHSIGASPPQSIDYRGKKGEPGRKPGRNLPNQILVGVDAAALANVDTDDGLTVLELARKTIGADDVTYAVFRVEGEFSHRTFAYLCREADELTHDETLCRRHKQHDRPQL